MSIIGPHMVVALAGRRIDAANATEVRFPIVNCSGVRRALESLLEPARVDTIVCSAAAGTDLIALDIAWKHGIAKHIVLPFDRRAFRELSVADRPGEWTSLFDDVLGNLASTDRLEVLNLSGGVGDDLETAFLAANQAIIERASAIAREPPHSRTPTAIVVWEGHSRGPEDITEDFRRRAERAGFTIHDINTQSPHVWHKGSEPPLK